MLGLYLKAFHVVFVVTWFAGLFYIVRLFVHFKESEKLDIQAQKVLKKQYQKMAKGLWLGITYPSMLLTLILGTALAHTYGFWAMKWLHLKLAFVLGLVCYHFYCAKLYRDVMSDALKISSFQLRLYNELASVFLFAIVFIVIFKNLIFQASFTIGIILLILLLVIAIYLFQKKRTQGNG